MKEILQDVFKTILSHIKPPRKGVAMILFIVLSILLWVDLVKLGHPFTLSGWGLQQVITAFWAMALFHLLAKAYEEYCDKQDAKKELEKQKLKEQKKAEQEKQEAQQKLNEYFEMFDLCDYQEKEVLEKFYYHQCTSIYIDNAAVVRAMNNKGIPFLTYEISFNHAQKALTSIDGLKIINKYFDKNKSKFFNLIKSLDEKEIKLLYGFVDSNEEQITLSKKEVKIAKSIIAKFQEANFGDIYIDENGFFTVSILYFAYIEKYFEENKLSEGLKI